MMADPSIAVFPLLALAYVLLLDNGPGAKPVWRRVLPSALVCSALWGAQLFFTWKYGIGYRLPAFQYWITEPWVILRYFFAALVPVHLTPVSDLKVFPYLWSPLALAGVAGLVALIVLAARLGKHERWRPVAFGLWWFLIALLPTVIVPQRAAESDTRMYVALFGFALAVARAFSIVYLRLNATSSYRLVANVAVTAVEILLLATLALMTYRRSEVWKSELSYWEDVTEKNPESARALMEYGAVLTDNGQTERGYENLRHGASLIVKNAPDEIRAARGFDHWNQDKEAETHFRAALDADPNYGPAWSAYSQWLVARERYPEAQKAALRALQLSPWNTEARHTMMQYYSSNSDWLNLKKTADAVLQVDPTDADGRRSETVAQTAFDAVENAEAKAKSDPSVDDFLSLSVKYYQMRRFEDSILACQNALKVHPDLAEAYSNMAAAYFALGKKAEAIKALRETIRIRPDLTVARKNLDFLLAQQAEDPRPAPATTP